PACDADVYFDYGYEFEERPESWTVGETTFRLVDQDVCLDRFKVRLTCIRQGEQLWAEFHYDETEISKTEKEWWAERVANVLEEATANPDRMIDELHVPGGREQEQVISTWNASAEPLTDSRWLHDQIAGQAMDQPQASAVAYAGEKLSYADLEHRANQVAHVL